MNRFRLYDSNFVGSESSSLYFAPQRLQWLRSGPNTPVTFCTDYHLDDAGRDAPFRIAWILEPEAINPEPYRFVKSHWSEFDLVLTHSAKLIEEFNEHRGDDRIALFYPNGMSWIAAHDWRKHPKSKDCSIIASSKAMTEGHQMRHRVIAKGGPFDVFGRGYRSVEHKVEALGPYRFSIAIENSSAPWYFTEKLIDCFATFTVPIYWGCPGISRFFDTSGMIVVSNEEEIAEVLGKVNEDLYTSMLPAMERNHEAARAYRVAEDWIVENILVPRGLV